MTRSTRSSAGPATFVDIAGDGAVRLAVHSHYGDELVHSMAVGVTHWEEFGAGEGELPGPTPSFFFAPDRVVKRSADWGARRPRDAGSPTPGTRSASGQPAGSRSSAARASTRFESAYLDVLEGRVDPKTAHVLSLE